MGRKVKIGAECVQRASGGNEIVFSTRNYDLYHSLPYAYHRDFQLKGWYRLIAVIQQRKANDPKRSFKVGIVSARGSAKADGCRICLCSGNDRVTELQYTFTKTQGRPLSFRHFVRSGKLTPLWF